MTVNNKSFVLQRISITVFAYNLNMKETRTYMRESHMLWWIILILSTFCEKGEELNKSSDSKSRIDAARLTRHSNSRRWIRMVNKGQMSFAATSLPLLDPYFVNTFAVPRCDKIALCRQLRIRTESWWRSPWRCNMKGKISLKSM